MATKLLAGRVSRDEGDILLLHDLLELTTVEEGLELLERHYPDRPIDAELLIDGAPWEWHDLR